MPSKAKDLILSGRQVDATEALAMGLVDRVLEPAELMDAAIAYAKNRDQFGESIGSFHAVAQACVDILASFQEVSAAARYAAVAAAAGRAEAMKAAHSAALWAGEAYRGATESVTNLFGGNGLSQEDDVHLYYGRAWSAERLAGGPQAQREAITDPAVP